MSNVKIFSATASTYLATQIADAYGRELGKVSLRKFSDGEISASFEESVRGLDVFLIQSTFPPSDNLMELLLLIDAAKRASAQTVTVIIPYFGYARQDRKDRPRVAIGAKLHANLLTAAGADRVVTLDLHAGQIQGFFDIPVVHLQSTAIFLPRIKSLNLENIVFASPDVGATALARTYAKHFDTNIVICDKYRRKPNESKTMHVIGNVEGMHAILVDDMIDTAGTITGAAEKLLEEGALSVTAFCTHPVLSGPAYERLANSKLTKLYVTDTIPLKEKAPNIEVLSVANLFAKAVRKINDHESISALFI